LTATTVAGTFAPSGPLASTCGGRAARGEVGARWRAVSAIWGLQRVTTLHCLFWPAGALAGARLQTALGRAGRLASSPGLSGLVAAPTRFLSAKTANRAARRLSRCCALRRALIRSVLAQLDAGWTQERRVVLQSSSPRSSQKPASFTTKLPSSLTATTVAGTFAPSGPSASTCGGRAVRGEVGARQGAVSVIWGLQRVTTLHCLFWPAGALAGARLQTALERVGRLASSPGLSGLVAPASSDSPTRAAPTRFLSLKRCWKVQISCANPRASTKRQFLFWQLASSNCVHAGVADTTATHSATACSGPLWSSDGIVPTALQAPAGQPAGGGRRHLGRHAGQAPARADQAWSGAGGVGVKVVGASVDDGVELVDFFRFFAGIFKIS
jgi:hypothetical protein